VAALAAAQAQKAVGQDAALEEGFGKTPSLPSTWL
jgi:hypothetical protein